MPVWTTLILAVTITADADASCAAPAAGCTAKPAAACQPCSPCAARTPCATVCSPCKTPCAVVNCHPCPQPVNPCSSCAASCDPCETTCDPCATSCDPCCDSCHPCWFPCSSWWSKACRHSTCNLYPHFAYFPECHGYYYFRPYNWVHIDQHRMTIPGQNFKNPYSNDVFDRLYADRDNLGEVDSDQVKPNQARLPLLEDLLK